MAVILVVDDEAAIREMVREALQVHGYTVAEAANGREGLDVLAKLRIDLVVLDIVMPDMNGFEFMTQAKKTAPTLPVIAMSGNPQKELYAQTANSMGAAFTLLKPFALAVLVEAVNLLLARPPAADQR
jgi:DNA-binding response OmpR family regulator